jgi:hypothetical protein
MLKLGGYLNILISIGHLIGLFWANKMFELTGIASEMIAFAKTHEYLPYFFTVFVAIVFFVFGIYGLSAANKYAELPFTKMIIFLIAGIYLIRGFAALLADFMSGTDSMLETIYSLVALFIGLLFLVGGINKWKFKRVEI